MSDEEYDEEGYEEGGETVEDLYVQLEQKDEQLQQAMEFYQALQEEKTALDEEHRTLEEDFARLEEDAENLREEFGEKEEEDAIREDKLNHAGELIQKFQEQNEELQEENETLRQEVQGMEYRVKEEEQQHKSLADENTKLREEKSDLEERRREEEEAHEEKVKELEAKIVEMEEEANREAEATASPDSAEDQAEMARRAEFQATGRSGRRSAVQLSDFANEQAVRRLTAEVEKLQEQLASSEAIREEEAKGRREATAAQKRMEPIMKNAVRDKEGAERREQDLIEEKDRLMGMLEKERIQIGSQQSTITGLEAEIQKLTQITAFSSNMQEAATPKAKAEKVEEKQQGEDTMGMMSLMDELNKVDEDAFQQERDGFQRQIQEEKKRVEAAKKELAKLQRQLEDIETNGTPKEQSIRSELEALKEISASDKAKVAHLDQENQRLQAEVTDSVARSSGMESSNSVLQADMKEQQAKVEEVEAERNKMAEDMKALRSSLDTLRTENLEKDGEMMKLRRGVRASETRIDELQEQLASGAGGDVDTAKLQSEIARLKAEGGDEELKEELEHYQETVKGLMEINSEQKEEIRKMYTDTADTLKLRQADSRENAALRTNLNKVESQALQLQEANNAMKREVDKYRREMKKSRMQVLLAQEQDDEIQKLQRQRGETAQQVKDLEAKIKEGQRARGQLENQISQLEVVILDNRSSAQKLNNELNKTKKEFTVVRAKLSLLQGRLGWDTEGNESGGKQVKDIQFEHFHMTAEGILMLHPLLAAGQHDIVQLYQKAKTDGIKFQNYHTWLKDEFVSTRNGKKGAKKGTFEAEAGSNGSGDGGEIESDHTLNKEDRLMLTQGNTFECYLKSGRVGRIKKQTVHLKVVDLDGSAAIEWIATNAKVNEEPKKILLNELNGIATGMEKSRASHFPKSVDKATRKGLCFSLVSKKPSKCLDLQVTVGGTVGAKLQQSWITALRFVTREAIARAERQSVADDTSGIYEVVSPASVVRIPCFFHLICS
jgi:hypothetical protein